MPHPKGTSPFFHGGHGVTRDEQLDEFATFDWFSTADEADDLSVPEKWFGLWLRLRAPKTHE